MRGGCRSLLMRGCWSYRIAACLLALLAPNTLSAENAPAVSVYSISYIKKRIINDPADYISPFRVEGYVIGISTCPPCPEEATCENCMPDHIILSERKRDYFNTPSEPDDLLIETKYANPANFFRGHKYMLYLETYRSAFPAAGQLNKLRLGAFECMDCLKISIQ